MVKHSIRPAVIWFTGLSAAGKSTIAQEVYCQLQQMSVPVEHLDGDGVRCVFPQTGFSREDRHQHLKWVAFLASKLEKHGVCVVASFISPYEESRQFVRSLCQTVIEVYVSTPLEICEQRDPKGLYAKARQGHIQHFTGLDDPYEPPAHPELTLDTSRLSINEATQQVIQTIQKRRGV